MRVIRFANGQTMVAGNNAVWQRIMDALNKTTEGDGIRISRRQTKVMRTSDYEGKRRYY